MRTANEEKELMKFISSPSYREKTILKIHKERDAQYNHKIKTVNNAINKLTMEHTKEIARIANARWENILPGKLAVNCTEGKVKINNYDVLFSSIKGAETNLQQGFRTITTDNSKSKKHASVGGALVGGALLGPVGAMVGGVSLGKTKKQGERITNQIPICMHLGVLVNIDGFVSEIPLLETQVDQSSTAFINAYNLAQQIVARLGALAKTPVPSGYLNPEDELSAKNIERQIAEKQAELQTIIADKPTYELPAMYRTDEQKEMSDEEYLEYLKQNDLIRQENLLLDKELKKQEKEQLKALKRQKSADNHSVSGSLNAKRIGSVIIDIIFWILSVFTIFASISSFTTSGGGVSGVILMITAVLVNPIIHKLIRNNIYYVKSWVFFIVFLVGLLAGIFTLPSSKEISNNYLMNKRTTTVVSLYNNRSNSFAATVLYSAKS